MNEPTTTTTGPKPSSALARGSMLGAGVVLAIVLAAMVNYVAARHYARFDWTASKLYSLSAKSLAVIDKVDRDIDAIVFLTPSTEVDNQVREQVSELLDRYAAANPRIKKRIVDPARDRLEAARLVQDFAIERANAVVIAAGDDRRVLDGYDFVDYDYSGASMGEGPSVKAFKGEQLITSAILELIEDHKPKVLLTTGHGEASLDGGGQRGMHTAGELLGRDNFELDSWQSIGQTAVPDDTDLVVVAGPTGRFLDSEIAALSRYLERGGRALLLLDPAIAGERFTDLGFGALLAGHGVQIADDLVIDPSQALTVGAETIFSTSYGSHPIVAPLTGRPVILPLARSARRAADVPAGHQVAELVLASAASWAETDLSTLPNVAPGDGEARGALPVAVAVSWQPAAAAAAQDAEPVADDADREAAVGADVDADDETAVDADAEAADNSVKARETRLVVIGDSDFATDSYVFDGANGELLLGAFNWLIERESMLEIAPRAPEQMKLVLSASELRTIYLLSLLVLPGSAVVAGIYVHLRRRR